MSIKIMSAIFEKEIPDLEYQKRVKRKETNEIVTEKRIAKASTVALLMLAIADHCNDMGESAYPGITTLEIKTKLSRQGVIDTIEACAQNSLLIVSKKGSKLGSNEYTINLEYLGLLVKPLYQKKELASKATLPEVVKPLYLNHHLTILENTNEEPVSIPPVSTTKNPAVLSYRHYYKRYPNELQRLSIIKTVTDLEKWNKSIEHWMMHGHNPSNVIGLLDSYSKGGEAGCSLCHPVNRSNNRYQAAPSTVGMMSHEEAEQLTR